MGQNSRARDVDADESGAELFMSRRKKSGRQSYPPVAFAIDGDDGRMTYYEDPVLTPEQVRLIEEISSAV